MIGRADRPAGRRRPRPLARHRRAWWGLLSVLWLLVPQIGHTTVGTGYTVRASGFDFDFNGTVGQIGSADLAVCDGQNDAASTTGEDLDANGVADRQNYVDLTSGTNSTTCGLPGSPCLTLAYVLAGTNASVAGGTVGQAASATQIQALCFKGTGREQVVPTIAGATGSYSLAATGHQVRAFNLPRYPFLLSGWDADNDNAYPPYDTDDTAVLDGNFGGTALEVTWVNSSHLSNLEIAHFTARDYGLTGAADEGFAKVAQGGGTATQIYFHDLQLTDIMKSEANASARIVFSFFVANTDLSYAAVVNVRCSDCGGGYFIRGSGLDSATVLGPYRFQNITVTAYGAASDFWYFLKLWDWVEDVEILDNNLSLQPTAWSPTTNPPTQGISASQCVRNWDIVGNTILDFEQGVAVTGYAEAMGFCENRTASGIRIDRNIIRNTYAAYSFGDWGISVLKGLDATATVENVTITNNFISSTVGYEACIWIQWGNDGGTQVGTMTIAGNTCYADINRYAGLQVGNPNGAEAAFVGNTFIVKDNLIAGLGASYPNVDVQYAPSSWTADYNAYDADADYAWNGTTHTTLANWRTASSGDAAGKECAPTLVDAATGDLHLQSSDTCAQDAGTSIAAYTTVDIDDTTRPQNSLWDIGADEYPSTLPTTPVHVRVITQRPAQIRWDHLTGDTVTGFRLCFDGATALACTDIGLPSGNTYVDTFAGYTSYTAAFPLLRPGQHSIAVSAYSAIGYTDPSTTFVVLVETR